MEGTKRFRLFGLSEDSLRQRLADTASAVTFTYMDGEAQLSLLSDEQELEEAVRQRVGDYIYSAAEETMEQRVVSLLTHHGLTVATAESCTGGLVSARLTGVSGSSRVFGTGVVSYSWDCKQTMLGVSPDTLKQEGAVCASTAGQMARGVRTAANARIGVSVTGEAGPTPAEQPVGTVYIALADSKRTWVKELHLQGERESIRRQAAGHLLFMLLRYLEAYPTVPAGGVSNHTAQRSIPRTQGELNPRLLSRVLPWRGDSLRRIAVKCIAWLAVLSVLGSAGYAGYRYLVEPNSNRQLQSSLGDMYRDHTTDLTVLDNGDYPMGMLAQFRGLYDRNTDVGGWVCIPNTAVDYPVMVYGDGQYRNHNFNNQYSVYGQPYFGVDTDLSHRTLTVYGRNTGDGQMFSDLLNYRRVAFLQEHSVIEMDTLYESARWQIFAVLVVDEDTPEECDYAQSTFVDEEAYAAYLSMLQQRSLFRSDRRVTINDRVLLLSTNGDTEYGVSSVRLVVAAYEMTETDTDATYDVNPEAKLPRVLAGERTTTRRPVLTTVTTTTQTMQTTTQSDTTRSSSATDDKTTTETTTIPTQDTTTTQSEDSTTVDADATTATTETESTDSSQDTTSSTDNGSAAVPDTDSSHTTQSTTQEDAETYDYTGN